jgi:ComF family protein
LEFLGSNGCQYCGRSVSSDYGVCTECEKKSFYFKKGISVLHYKNIGKELILKLKLQQKRYISYYFSRLIYDKIKITKDFHFDVITYVPIAKNKMKLRGFNQSQLIAKYLSELTNKPLIKLLDKKHETKAMKMLNAFERQKVLRDAFQLHQPGQSVNRVLIVDDVFTTGATLNECSKVLYENNIKEILVATVAAGEINYNY